MIIWMDGLYSEDYDVEVPCLDRGFLLGDGVFDTMLGDKGSPIFAKEHFARLKNHAHKIGIILTYDADHLKEAAINLLKQNDLTEGRASIRTTITRGIGQRGLALPDKTMPMMLMMCAPVPDFKDAPLKAVICETLRRNEYSPSSQIKSLGYLDNILAKEDAARSGADDAILLNTKGHVTGTTIGNIFLVEEGCLITPPITDGTLDGVTRQKIIELAEAEFHEPVKIEPILPDRLETAEFVFMTNSLLGMRELHINKNKSQPPLLFGHMQSALAAAMI